MPLLSLSRSSPRPALLALALAITRHAAAQDLTHKAPPQQAPLTIYNITLHPVTAAKPDEVIEHAFITFDRGVIADIGTNTALPAADSPSAKNFIDGKGAHLYPGLIGANTQLGLTEMAPIRPSNDLSETGNITPEVCPATAVNPDSTLIPVARTNGVLTVATAPSGGLIPGQSSIIQLDGWTTGDMALIRNAGICLNWPAMTTVTAWWMRRSAEEQEKDIRKNLDALNTVFDTAQAYAIAREADHNAPVDLRWEAMLPIFGPPHEKDGEKAGDPASDRLPLWVNANDLDQISAAVAFAQKRRLRLIIVGGRDAPLCAQLLKDNHVPIIFTGTFSMPRRSDAGYDDAYSLPKQLFDAGITFAIASNDESAHERNLPYQAAMSAAHGLPPAEALKAVTISAAQICGIGARLGSIEKGKLATFLLTSGPNMGNPLEVTTRIDHAYIAGREIDLSNKQSKLYEKYRDRYRQMGILKDENKPGQNAPTPPR